jgi:hypothetical protein
MGDPWRCGTGRRHKHATTVDFAPRSAVPADFAPRSAVPAATVARVRPNRRWGRMFWKLRSYHHRLLDVRMQRQSGQSDPTLRPGLGRLPCEKVSSLEQSERFCLEKRRGSRWPSLWVSCPGCCYYLNNVRHVCEGGLVLGSGFTCHHLHGSSHS